MMGRATIFLLCPLMLLVTALSGGYANPLPVQISESQASIIRVGALLIVCAFSMVVCVKSRLGCKIDKYFALGFVVWALGAIVSVLANSSSNWYDALLRPLLVLVVGIAVLIVSGQTKTESALNATIRTVLIYLAAIVAFLVVSFFAYGPFIEWSFRLGPPLNPRVAAEIICVSLFCIFYFEKNSVSNRSSLLFLLKVLLFVLLVWTGGRTAIAVTTAFFVVSFFFTARMGILGKVVISLVVMSSALVVGLYVAEGSWFGGVESLYTRSDLSAGRFDLWAETIEQSGSILVGVGDRYEVNAGDLDAMRLHNGLLESLVSYGIINLLGTLIVYARIVVIAMSQKKQSFFATSYFASIILSEILFGTSIIGNVADAFFYVSIYVFSAISFAGNLDRR